jgi:hypothetical protein
MRWVVGFEGLYLVHKDGRVFNRFAREMKQRIDRDGYVTVRLTRGGRQSWKRINRLVCEAWRGPAPDGAHAAHVNGDLRDNSPGNLKWKSPRANNADKIAHGTHQAGEQHPRVKLTAAEVDAIRASGLSSRTLAREYGVNQSQIVRIKNRTRWAEGIAQPFSQGPSQ